MTGTKTEGPQIFTDCFFICAHLRNLWIGNVL